MRAFNAMLYRFLREILTYVIGAMLIPISIQIFSRFFDFIPRYIWTEEAARFLLVWMILIGASIAVRDGTHFDVEVLPTPKTVKGAAAAHLFVHGAMFLVALIFVFFGWSFAAFGWDQNSEMTGINMISIHAAWPIAGFIWVLFLTEKIIDDYKLYKGEQS